MLADDATIKRTLLKELKRPRLHPGVSSPAVQTSVRAITAIDGQTQAYVAICMQLLFY